MESDVEPCLPQLTRPSDGDSGIPFATFGRRFSLS